MNESANSSAFQSTKRSLSVLLPRLKGKRIAGLTIPLLGVATLAEIAILVIGWNYQRVVCVPQGMGVMFFGIGPIGATILAVELLKLPLAIWTASRHGWKKVFMLTIGLPLICVLTFQLVKDMAVYEMGVAMTPAAQMLEKAAAEDTKIAQLNGELAAIEQKKAERERKLAEFATKRTKAKADLEEALKRNDESRQDAINLTDYQKKELSDVEARQAKIIAQFNADTAQLNKEIADLRARREIEVARSSKWNTEEARIENEYKAKKADYDNRKAAYDKAKDEYDNANFIKRKLMREPVSPGVPPDREVNSILKPTAVAEIDAQVKTKEAELLAVNNKRRDSVAQVEADARRLREEYDRRSSTRRDKTDTKREELAAAQTAMLAGLDAEEKVLDQDLAAAVKKVDGIRAQIDACRKTADGYYEAREAAIRKTQVHRIATTVEIVRGLIKGERPQSIKATPKERGDVLTDQISMVRIWVYPVFAFIVAFLPTLMVEIGFSTIFEPEEQRPRHRLGFLGRRMHWLYTRAGRLKILRYERLANEASSQIAARESKLAAANRALAEKEVELQAAQESMNAAATANREQLSRKEEDLTEQWKAREAEWVSKLGGMADSLNRAVVEKDALRDMQRSEVERQVQTRQNAWSDRISQMRQELDDQRAAGEAERLALMQEHHRKLMDVTEDCKTQVIQARRQMADAELAAVEKIAKVSQELKEAQHARDEAESQLKHQADGFSVRLTQTQEDGARQLEKLTRQEKHRFERQQLEFEKTLRQREEDFEHRLKQREQELSLAFDSRLAEEKGRLEQHAREREAGLEQQIEARTRDLGAHWSQEAHQRDEAAQFRLKQREQQLQAQAEARLKELQAQFEEQSHRRELDLERRLEAVAREADTRLKQESQQRELGFQARLKQREQELALKAEARETELQTQWAAESRTRDEERERQTEARLRAAETRLAHEAQQKEELFGSRLRQREQQWQAKLDATRGELQAQAKELLRRREVETGAALRDLDAQLRKEMQQKEEAFQVQAKQREQEIVAQVAAQAEARQLAAQAQWETEAERKTLAALEPYKALLARAERERDEARQTAAAGARHVQHLEEKLTEASSFLSSWRSGKQGDTSLSWSFEKKTGNGGNGGR
jgi:hypothetical protein